MSPLSGYMNLYYAQSLLENIPAIRRLFIYWGERKMDETKQINFCFLLVYKVSLEICKLEAGSNNQKIIYSEMNLANANKY